MAEFHALAEAYESPAGDDWDSEAVLADPRWQEVVRQAQRAQARLLPLLSDPAERKALTEPLVWRDHNGGFQADLTGSSIVRAGRSSFRQIVNRLRRKLFG